MVEEPQTAQNAAPEEHQPQTPQEHPDAPLAHLFLEDFVVTALLRVGRALSHSELNASSEGLSLGRSALRRALANSSRIAIQGREYELKMRVQANGESRQERTRRPLEATIDNLLSTIGKPLPLPVIAREVANLRGILPEGVRESCAHILQTSRGATQTAPNTWIHSDLLLDAGTPNEALLIRENRLGDDPNFAQLSQIEYSKDGELTTRAAAVLNQSARPISHKLLGFLLRRQDAKNFDGRVLAQAIGDRATFYSLVGGTVTTPSQMPVLRRRTQNWLSSEGGSSVSQVDLMALLRKRLPPQQTVAPQAAELEEITRLARSTKAPISIVSVLTDMLEIEPDDAAFAGTLQGLNDNLRSDKAWLPAGAGRFLLRELVPEGIGQTPEALRPIHLPIRNPVTNEPLDIEMSDDGLEGDCVEFVHDPQWEDVGEEVEVKMARRQDSEPTSTRYVITYPHYQEGTMKLRRLDEDFFGLEGALSRLPIWAHDDEGREEITAWASRDSGLIYGLGAWYRGRTAPSGGVLEFSRDAANRLNLRLGQPDKLMSLDLSRVEELEELQERSGYVALFDLLQTVMSARGGGSELQTLWAEVNVVRRISKRLMCSVLSAYNCFSFKQRGPKQILWRFDAAKLDQGFKKNKRKYVRR